MTGSTAPRYETASVLRADMQVSVNAIGTLQPHRYVDVGAHVSGQIMRLAAESDGQDDQACIALAQLIGGRRLKYR